MGFSPSFQEKLSHSSIENGSVTLDSMLDFGSIFDSISMIAIID